MHLSRLTKQDLALYVVLGIGLAIGLTSFAGPLALAMQKKSVLYAFGGWVVGVPIMALWMWKVVEPISEKAKAVRDDPFQQRYNAIPAIAIAVLTGVCWLSYRVGYRDGVEHVRESVLANCESKHGYANAARCVREYTFSWRAD